MTNRNDPCPCGSGLKYKKCCRHLKVISSTPKSSGLPASATLVTSTLRVPAFQISTIISIEYGAELPFLPDIMRKNGRAIINAALNFLEQSSDVKFELSSDFANRMCLRIIMGDRKKTHHRAYQDEYDEFDEYDEDYDADEDWNPYYKEDFLEIFFSEITPDGLMKIDFFRNKKKEDIWKNVLEINAAMSFVWMGLAVMLLHI